MSMNLNLHREAVQISRVNKGRIYDNLLTIARLLFLPASLGLNLFEKSQQAILQLYKQSETEASKGNPFPALKFAMLAHTILLYQDCSYSSTLHLKIYENLYELLNKLQCFLKSCLFKDKKSQYTKDSIVCLNCVSYKTFLKKINFQISNLTYQIFKLEPAYDRCYKLVNMMSNGVLLIQKLMQFMRYYLKQYAYLLDMCLLLAQDFADIYKQIYHEVHQCIQMHAEIESKNQLTELMKQIEKLHEPLQILYLNKYSRHLVRRYIPIWIKTETIQIKLPKKDRFRKSSSLNSSIMTECSLREHMSHNSSCTSIAQRESKADEVEKVAFSSNIMKLQTDNFQILRQLQESFHQKFSQNVRSNCQIAFNIC